MPVRHKLLIIQVISAEKDSEQFTIATVRVVAKITVKLHFLSYVGVRCRGFYSDLRFYLSGLGDLIVPNLVVYYIGRILGAYRLK